MKRKNTYTKKYNYKRRNKYSSLADYKCIFLEVLVAIVVLLRSLKLINTQNFSVILKIIFGLLLFLIVIGFLPRVICSKVKKHKYLNSNICKIDNMSGEEFEELLKAHFEKLGYKVSLTPASNDYGADLILTKPGEKVAVQAKRYKNKVGNKAVQEIIGAKGYYGADTGMVVTNSFYTANAVKLADANDVILWDRKSLIQEFNIDED